LGGLSRREVNLGSRKRKILDQWEESKKRQAENREEPFDVAQFEARVRLLEAEKEHRRNCRRDNCSGKGVIGNADSRV
jgi:hypothetical protein